MHPWQNALLETGEFLIAHRYNLRVPDNRGTQAHRIRANTRTPKVQKVRVPAGHHPWAGRQKDPMIILHQGHVTRSPSTLRQTFPTSADVGVARDTPRKLVHAITTRSKSSIYAKLLR